MHPTNSISSSVEEEIYWDKKEVFTLAEAIQKTNSLFVNYMKNVIDPLKVYEMDKAAEDPIALYRWAKNSIYIDPAKINYVETVFLKINFRLGCLLSLLKENANSGTLGKIFDEAIVIESVESALIELEKTMKDFNEIDFLTSIRERSINISETIKSHNHMIVRS